MSAARSTASLALLLPLGALVMCGALVAGGCDVLENATDRLAAAVEDGDLDQGEQWCAAFNLAIVACDVDHYIDETKAMPVALGCTDVALAAAGFDVLADPDGRTVLMGALLGAYGLYDPSGFENASAACQ